MGRRGPIARSPHLRVLEGRGSRRRNAVQAEDVAREARTIRARRLVAPRTLSAAARAEWVRVLPGLEARGLIVGASDRALLAIYAESWARWQEAQRHLRAEGAVYVGPNGAQCSSPWVRIGENAWKAVERCAVHFGLSPMSRERLPKETPREETAADLPEELRRPGIA